ncbi:MAG TPA: TolC family protein [Gemmatimonadaceae bacterium]|nr:TolC family protein [Gemmatimonadaceae bacterium]
MKSYGMVRGAVAALLLVSSTVASRPALGQAPGDGAPIVTLTEARRRAASVSPTTVAARSQVETASWQRRAALADVLTPTVTAGGSYTHFSEPFFNFGTGTISPNATSATLEARYTVLGAGKLGELKSARASLESAEASETAARFRTAMATDAAYYAVLADRELVRVANDRLRRAEEQLGVARVRVLAGEAIAPDSLQLLLEVNRAKLDVLSRDSALVTSRLRLGRQIGLSGPADAAPIDSAVPPQLPLTLDEAIAEMRLRGPDVEAARAAERRADAIVLAEREQYLPSITLGAITGAYDAEMFPSASRRTQLAVTVSLPIWNGGQRELAVARARAERNVARAERQDSERGAAEVIAQAYHGYLTSRAGIELAISGVTVSSENFRVQRARYREGATTILDLLEAQVALSEAEARLVQARYSARLALAQIESLLGRRLFE